jgi:regulator of protease activity HflC (stomatin/prohibitin superfamily)
MDILRLLDDLNQIIDSAPTFGPVTWGLNREEVSMQITKIRASLPQELRTAVNNVRESERLIDTAKEDAVMTLESAKKEAERVLVEAKRESDRIVEQAKIQQERMVAESEILKLSKAQSEEIRNAADRDAVNMRRGAEKYAYDVLSQLEGVVGKVMTSIEKGKQEVYRPETGNQPVPREKARV